MQQLKLVTEHFHQLPKSRKRLYLWLYFFAWLATFPFVILFTPSYYIFIGLVAFLAVHFRKLFAILDKN